MSKETTSPYELVEQQVRSRPGTPSPKVQMVPAYAVNEFFSAHPSMGIRGWTVTHRATGASISTRLTRRGAIELCDVAVSTATGSDLGSDDPDLAVASLSNQAIITFASAPGVSFPGYTGEAE